MTDSEQSRPRTLEEFRKLTGVRTPQNLAEVSEIVNHPTPEEAAEHKADWERRSRASDEMMARVMGEQPEVAETIRNAYKTTCTACGRPAWEHYRQYYGSLPTPEGNGDLVLDHAPEFKPSASPWWDRRFIRAPIAWAIIGIMLVLFVVGVLVTPPSDNPILRFIWTVVHDILTLTQ